MNDHEVVRLALEPETSFTWRAGQFISLEHPSGAQRSYSIAASVEDAYFIDLHVRRVAGGLVSAWLCDEVEVGDVLRLRGPFGDCVYDPLDADRDLLLVASGTGLASLIGVAKDALRLGHRGRIELVHGSSHMDGLYLGAALRALAEREGPDRFAYHAWLDPGLEALGPGVQPGNAVDAAFARDRLGTVTYLAGSPAMAAKPRFRPGPSAAITCPRASSIVVAARPSRSRRPPERVNGLGARGCSRNQLVLRAQWRSSPSAPTNAATSLAPVSWMHAASSLPARPALANSGSAPGT